MRQRHLTTTVVLATLGAALLSGSPAADARGPSLLTSTSFTTLTDVGQPTSIAATHDGFYVVLLNHDNRAAEVDSPILRIDRRGTVVGSVPLHVPGWDHDVERPFSVTVDGDGLIYVGTGAHIYQVDPMTGGGRVYAEFPHLDSSLPPCPAVLDNGSLCDSLAYPSLTQTEPRGLYSAFGPGGALYVADDNYNVIWQVPRGGGEPTVWAAADGADVGFFGLYQIVYDRAEHSIKAALGVTTGVQAGVPGAGSVLSWSLKSDGSAGPQRVAWASSPAAGVYGLGVGVAGRMVTTGFLDSSMSVIDPDGATIAREGDPTTRTRDVPFDNPSGLAWKGRYAYVANPSAHLNLPENRAILKVYVGEVGQRPMQPRHLGDMGQHDTASTH